MDWDAIGMHVWLINIGCQQDPAGTIPDDIALIRRWLRSPSDDVWRRVWPQLSAAWIVTDGRRANAGTVRACEKARAFSDSRREGAYALHKHRIRDAKEVEEEIEVEVDVSKIKPKSKEVLVSFEISNLEELIYSDYPRKVGRPEGLKAISKAVRKIQKQFHLADNEAAEYLHKAVLEFARSPAGQRGTYTPHPATWMNQERWNDDRTEWYRESGAQNRSQTSPGAARANRAVNAAAEAIADLDPLGVGCAGEDAESPSRGESDISDLRASPLRHEPITIEGSIRKMP